MEINTIEEGELNDVAGEEVAMEDIDYAKVKNKFIKPKKRVARKTEAIPSSETLATIYQTI
jgi:hypothetical protein